MKINQRDLETAAKIHYSFLPQGCSNEYVDIDVKVKPKEIVGGDYCSIMPINREKLLVNMCDVTNHNVASALYAARLNTFVLTRAQRHPDPCTLINLLNEFLVKQSSNTHMYASFCSVLFDFENMEIQYAAAGHPPVLQYNSREEKMEHHITKAPFLGYKHPLPITCEANGCSIGSGDKVILHTDGLSEISNESGEPFGIEGIDRFTESHHTFASAAFNKRLVKTAVEFGNNRIEDDILLMTITVK